MLAKKISDQWAFVENVTDSGGRSYRVFVNKGDIEKTKDKNRPVAEFLVPDTNDAYFECLTDLSNPFVGCNGTVDYGESLSLNFRFKRTEFERWREIHNAVFKLLDSFRQPA